MFLTPQSIILTPGLPKKKGGGGQISAIASQMVKSCCVWACTALYRPGVNPGFYKFPKDVDRRRDWVRKINRVKVVSSAVSRSGICASNVAQLWEPGKVGSGVWSSFCHWKTQ